MGNSTQKKNPFFEYCVFNKNRTEFLNLLSFKDLKFLLTNG